MKSLLSLALFFIILQPSFAQFPDSTLIQHKIDSKAFGDERQVTVHLPSRYFSKPDDKMVVTYVLDAQGPQYFNMLIANMDYLTSRYGIMPTIVVGIHAKDRYTEFTPFAREGNPNEWENKFESKLPNLYEHLEKEVFPWVEANFRTKPFRTIIGHSRGGSFVVQCLFDGHKDLFDAYIAISPALQFDNYQSIDMAKQSLSSKVPMNKFFYSSAGDIGGNEIAFADHVDKLDKVIKEYSDPTLNYHTRSFPGKDHFTTVIPSLNEGLILLKNECMISFENMEEYAKNPTVALTQQMEQFAQERKSKNQYLFEPSMRYFKYQADDFFEREDYKNALDLYLWIDARESLSKWWEVFNIGKCHYKEGNADLAEQRFSKSLEILDTQQEEYGEKFASIKEDLQQQIAEMK